MNEFDRLFKEREIRMGAEKLMLDGIAGDDDSEMTLGIGSGDYVAKDLALKGVAALHEWADTQDDDLGSGESYADRLLALFVGVVDADKNGEIDDDEQAGVDIALTAAGEYLSSKGVSEDDIDSLLSDWDNDAAERVIDLLRAKLPDGEDAMQDDMDNFVFGESAEDGAVFDSVYKKVRAVRNGRKIIMKKRVSGFVKHTPKQKMAIKKMQLKSHSAKAQMKRAKSMRMRRKTGM
jgi:hypothetical protein